MIFDSNEDCSGIGSAIIIANCVRETIRSRKGRVGSVNQLVTVNSCRPISRTADTDNCERIVIRVAVVSENVKSSRGGPRNRKRIVKSYGFSVPHSYRNCSGIRPAIIIANCVSETIRSRKDRIGSVNQLVTVNSHRAIGGIADTDNCERIVIRVTVVSENINGSRSCAFNGDRLINSDGFLVENDDGDGCRIEIANSIRNGVNKSIGTRKRGIWRVNYPVVANSSGALQRSANASYCEKIAIRIAVVSQNVKGGRCCARDRRFVISSNAKLIDNNGNGRRIRFLVSIRNRVSKTVRTLEVRIGRIYGAIATNRNATAAWVADTYNR